MRSTSERNAYYQKLYPSVNNEDLLEFRIPPNQKSHMCLSDVLLRFVLRIKQPSETSVHLFPDNYLGAKQFSAVEVRINGEAVSRRNCANEYFHSINMQYLVNFAIDYATTSCRPVGLFDDAGYNTDDLSDAHHGAQKVKALINNRSGINGDYVYEIVMPIDSSIFTSNDKLPTKTPLELSFERCKARVSTILSKATEETLPHLLELEDPYLLVPYVTDLEMEEKERNAATNAIKINYDDYAINRFNISKDSPTIRIPNALTGTLPKKIFFGIMPLTNFTGDFHQPSTIFKRNLVKKATLYVDGNVLSGYPITVSDNLASIPYTRFQQNINRYMNCYSSRSVTMKDFRDSMFLYSAELDSTTSGSLTFEFDFDNAPTEDMVLVTCGVHERTIEIDSFRNFQVV